LNFGIDVMTLTPLMWTPPGRTLIFYASAWWAMSPLSTLRASSVYARGVACLVRKSPIYVRELPTRDACGS
jgi:hypothetical protein